ncbi:hypothetical protein MMC32_007207 [Xylographa parallela]|nr:hypothetical protein [Xylographa parallela]
MRASVFLGLVGLATVALARVPPEPRSGNVGIYVRSAEPEYEYHLSERDEKNFLAQLYARDLDYDLFERNADPYEVDEPLELFVRADHGIFDSTAAKSHTTSVGKGTHQHEGEGVKKTSSVHVTSEPKDPKHNPHPPHDVPFYLPARVDSDPVKYKIVDGKTVRQRRSVYDDYYSY